MLGVLAVWLGILGAAVLTMPSMAPPPSAFVIEPVHSAHLLAPPLLEWSIPSDRLEFDAYTLALERDDEMALAKIEAAAEWTPVRSQQMVLVVMLDGDAAQVELLDGVYIGHRGWLRRQQLVP